VTYLPTTRDEEWRYADAEALVQLAPAEFDVWHEAVLTPACTACA
jgi:Fe-S cluster assembly protein SufD